MQAKGQRGGSDRSCPSEGQWGREDQGKRCPSEGPSEGLGNRSVLITEMKEGVKDGAAPGRIGWNVNTLPCPGKRTGALLQSPAPNTHGQEDGSCDVIENQSLLLTMTLMASPPHV